MTNNTLNDMFYIGVVDKAILSSSVNYLLKKSIFKIFSISVILIITIANIFLFDKRLGK